MTENKGYGVKSLRALKKGDFILEYIGEVVTVEEFMERMRGIYANDTHHYCLQLDSKIVIDGHRSGGEGKTCSLYIIMETPYLLFHSK